MIRNSCVARGTCPASTGVVAYTIPSGNTFLFKSILIGSGTTPSSNCDVYIRNSDSSVFLLLTTFTTDARAHAAWDGWIALNATDQVFITAGATQIVYWLSGAVLPFNPVLQ